MGLLPYPSASTVLTPGSNQPRGYCILIRSRTVRKLIAVNLEIFSVIFLMWGYLTHDTKTKEISAYCSTWYVVMIIMVGKKLRANQKVAVNSYWADKVKFI